MKRQAKCILGLLLLAHTSLLAYSAYVHSPTFNESAHLAAGLIHLKFHRFDVYTVNPPLVRTISSIPVAIVGYNENWTSFRAGPADRPEMRLGEDFVAANGTRSLCLMTIARLTCIPFSLVGAYCCWRWAYELYGARSGLLAAALWCFSPNIIGHGSLITPDVSAASLGIAACYTFWRWLRAPTWRRAFLSGVVLGIAELTKTTLIVFFPLWPILWIVYRVPTLRENSGPRCVREAGMLLVCIGTAIYVLNIAYVFEGSLRPLKEFRFVSQTLTGTDEDQKPGQERRNRFSECWLGHIPVPVPASYLIGIDLQRRDFESYPYEAYLRGKFQEQGWWYYYLYGLAVKTPIGLEILFLLTVGLRLSRRTISRVPAFIDHIVLLSPAAVILALVSSQTGLNEHVRYVFPILPFVFVWVGQIADLPRQSNILGHVVAFLLSVSITSSLQCYPHSISYFNELVGGPRRGTKHLIHSNIDWGQDLTYLRDTAKSQRGERLYLAYFGGFDPVDLGIDFEAPPLQDHGHFVTFPPGSYAVSVQLLKDIRAFPDGKGSKAIIHPGIMKQMLKWKPDYYVGYSIYGYRIDESKSLPIQLD